MTTSIETPADFWYRRRMLFPSIGRYTAVRDLVNLFRKYRVRSVADFGCGPGEATLAMRRAGMRVLAVDKDRAAVRTLLHREIRSRDFRGYVGDWRSLVNVPALKNAVDAVCCIGNALVYVDSWSSGKLATWTTSVTASLLSMAAILRRGGICYIDTTAWRDLEEGLKDHLVGRRRMYGMDTRVEWRQEVSARERILHARRVTYDAKGTKRTAHARLVSYPISALHIAVLAEGCGFVVEGRGALLPHEALYESVLLRKR